MSFSFSYAVHFTPTIVCTHTIVSIVNWPICPLMMLSAYSLQECQPSLTLHVSRTSTNLNPQHATAAFISSLSLTELTAPFSLMIKLVSLHARRPQRLEIWTRKPCDDWKEQPCHLSLTFTFISALYCVRPSITAPKITARHAVRVCKRGICLFVTLSVS